MMVPTKLKCLPWRWIVSGGLPLWWVVSMTSWRNRRLAMVSHHSMCHTCSMFNAGLQFRSLKSITLAILPICLRNILKLAKLVARTGLSSTWTTVLQSQGSLKIHDKLCVLSFYHLHNMCSSGRQGACICFRLSRWAKEFTYLKISVFTCWPSVLTRWP